MEHSRVKPSPKNSVVGEVEYFSNLAMDSGAEVVLVLWSRECKAREEGGLEQS